MKSPLCALSLLFLSVALADPLGDPMARLGANGFIDKSGALVIPPLYFNASDFSEGLAAVVTDKGTWSFIDREGKLVIQPNGTKWDAAGPFHDGCARVRVGEKWGFIGKNGNWIVEPQFLAVADFSDGLAAVAVPRVEAGDRSTGGWGYIDPTGKLVIGHQFFSAGDFSEGLAWAKRRGGREFRTDTSGTKVVDWEEFAGFIDKTGATVIPPQFARAMSFSEGLACVQFAMGTSVHGKSAFIDRQGRVIIDLTRWAAEPFGGNSVEAASFHEGLAFIDTATGFVHVPKWGFIDQKGSVAFTAEVNGAAGFSEGLARIMKGKLKMRHGYINRMGTIVLEPKFKAAGDFREGLAAVAPDARWGYIDPTGRFVIEPKFKYAAPFHEGLARVTVQP